MPKLTIKGEVIAVTKRETTKGDVPIVVVDQTEDPKWAEAIAVEFFGKSAPKTEGVGPGDAVEIRARVTSREHKGRWFTGVNGYDLTVTGRLAETPPASTVQSGQAPVADGDDPMPF